MKRLSPGLQKLLGESAFCQVATLMPDGSPQVTQVWVSTDGEHFLVNTYEGAQKLRNMRGDPRVAVNVVDPANAWRLANIRGESWTSPPREPTSTSTNWPRSISVWRAIPSGRLARCG